jgi:Tol biopolymer transport system component
MIPGRFLSAVAKLRLQSIVALACLTLSQTLSAVEPIKLSGELVERAIIEPGSLEFSPDGSRVLYQAGYLYTVPTAGGMPVQLGRTLPPHQFTADGKHIVAFGLLPESQELCLFRVSSAGSNRQKLNHSFAVGESMNFNYRSCVQFSSDRSRVVYLTTKNDVYSVPCQGGNPVKLNSSGHRVDGHNFRFSPDSKRVIYVRAIGAELNPTPSWPPNLGDKCELYSVPSIGGVPTKIAEAGHIWSFQVSPDSRRIIYLTYQSQRPMVELYSVPIDGGPSAKLNIPPGDHSRVLNHADPEYFGRNRLGPQCSPDCKYVLYMVGDNEREKWELYSVPMEGGESVKLSEQPIVSRALFSADSQRVLFVSSQSFLQNDQLYSVPVKGGVPLRLDQPQIENPSVSPWSIAISSDGTRVVFIGEQDTPWTHELYSVPVGGGKQVKLSGGNKVCGHEYELLLSPDARHVLYLEAKDHAGSRPDLYLCPIAGGAPIRLTNSSPFFELSDGSARFSPDGKYLLYISQNGQGLFSVEVPDEARPK